MKKSKFFQDTKKDMVAFMTSTLVVLGVGYFCVNDEIEASSLCHHQVMTAQVGTASQVKEDPAAQYKDLKEAMAQLQKIGKKKSKLEHQKAKVAAKLKKAKTDRDADRGMVPGTCFAAPQGLSEVLSLEFKMKSIDKKIGVLNRSQGVILAKYGKDIQKMNSPLLAKGD